MIVLNVMEGGPIPGGGSGWAAKVDQTPKVMGMLLNGRVVTKFELQVDAYKTETAIITFSDGNKLHVYSVGEQCRLEYYKLVKKPTLG